MAYRLTQAAAQDVVDIYRLGLARFGVRQADAYHALLERSFRYLSDNPLAARERLEISPPVRIHPVQAHLVIYQRQADGDILIVRVRHGHEDWADPVSQD